VYGWPGRWRAYHLESPPVTPHRVGAGVSVNSTQHASCSRPHCSWDVVKAWSKCGLLAACCLACFHCHRLQ
jgi:hypothetical protein